MIGGGPIGVEFSSFYNTLGAEVTLVERLDHILPQEDPSISDALTRSLRSKGIMVRTGTSVCEIKGKNNAKLTSDQNGSEDYNFDCMVLAVGIRPNTYDLGLEKIGVERNERGFVRVSDTMETTCKGVYAIGDIVDGPALAHKASYEGGVCVDAIVGKRCVRIPHRNIPRCVYTSPQVASTGWTECELEEQGVPVRVGVFPYSHNGRALSSGDKEGFVKMLYHRKTGELLGAHILGENASELIHTVALGITSEVTESEMMSTVFPHPTLSEMLQESTLAAYDIGLHA